MPTIKALREHQRRAIIEVLGELPNDLVERLVTRYDHHNSDAVHLYLEESFSFRVATPEAAVAITPA